jgi:Activator of Hsp90 ATPase homolog 1-like protein
VITVQPGELALRMKRIVRHLPPRCSRPAPHPRSWRNGGVREALPPRPSSSTCASAAAIGSPCSPRRGDLFHLTGEFREVDPPSRLAYTFRWEPPDPDERQTVVTLAFHKVDGSTEVDFTQGVFATEARRALHEQGWTESFGRLQELLSAP